MGHTDRCGRGWWSELGCAPPKVTPQFPAEPGLTVRPLRSQPRGQRAVHTVPGTQEGLPFPLSFYSQGPESSFPGAARAVEEPEIKWGGGREALGQNGVSLPHFHTPIPLVPRPGAASSSQRWGWRVGQEGGGVDPGLPVPPHTHTPLVFSLSLLGLRAGSPGAVVSEVDRAALSFLPSGGRGGAGGGTGSDAPSPPPVP